jgi:CHAD domain-containing protein
MPRPRCREVPLCRYADPLIEDLRERLSSALDDGDPDAIHDARVNTRRLRAVVDLLEPTAAGEFVGGFGRALRKLRRRLGPLRDLDVMIEAVEPLTRHPRRGPAATWMRDQLRVRQAVARRKTRKKTSADKLLDRLDAWEPLRRQIVRLGEAADGLIVASLRSHWDAFAAKAGALSLDLMDGHRDGAINPHELRIAGKMLRYTFEMLGEARPAIPAMVRRVFKQMQDALGRWHDDMVFSEWALKLSIDERLAIHDSALQKETLSLANFALARGERSLRRFAALWRRHGPIVAELVAEIVNARKTDRDPSGSLEPRAPEADPSDASSAA